MADDRARRKGHPVTRRVLDEILEAKRIEIAELAQRPCAPRARPRPGSVLPALTRSGPLRLIAEIKRRSPSAGPLSTVLSVGERALAYARGGAAMISVLCDTRFFDGGWAHLLEARSTLDAAGLATPLLAKEFVLDERQLEEAAACGADAALLIVRIVPPARLAPLVTKARALDLEPVVEVVTEDELAVALDAGATVIGVNARDLDTLEIDTSRASSVLAAIPDDRIAVHLSGLKRPADVAGVAATPIDAALIGEALMREADPSELLRTLIAATG